MKTYCYRLALMALLGLSAACSDDNAALPSDYTNVGVESGSIDKMLFGQWKSYVITRTIYSNGQEQKQTIGGYTGDVRFDEPIGSASGYLVHNFPSNGRMFEVRRYGERLDFYYRAANEHTNLMLKELTPTKVVFQQHQMHNQDYYIVIAYTLTK